MLVHGLGIPYYTHDCSKCRYVASVVVFGQAVDVYKSCSSIDGGFIIRYSNEPSDYSTPSRQHIDSAICTLLDCGR